MLSKNLGTRHRAAIGITEETDAIAVVVSEETGTISMVTGGKMLRGLSGESLVTALKDATKDTRGSQAKKSYQTGILGRIAGFIARLS